MPLRTALRGLGRTLAMPATRPAQQIASSARAIAGEIDGLQQRRAARAAALEEQARALRLDEIEDAAERFETVRRARGLSDEDLALKLAGLRRNRRIFAALAAGLAVGGLAWLASAAARDAGLIASLAGLCMLLASPMAAAQAFVLGLYSHQIERRRLDSASAYLARRDLIKHWLWW